MNENDQGVYICASTKTPSHNLYLGPPFLFRKDHTSCWLMHLVLFPKTNTLMHQKLMHAMIDKHQQDVLRMGYLHVYLLLQYNQLVLYFAIIQSIHRSTSSSLCCWKILFWALLHSTYLCGIHVRYFLIKGNPTYWLFANYVKQSRIHAWNVDKRFNVFTCGRTTWMIYVHMIHDCID